MSILLFSALAAWCGHTARSLTEAKVIRRTVAVLGWKMAEMAERLGISEQQWSRQLAGIEPFNHWRFSDLPDEFQIEYDLQRAKQRGAMLIEREAIAIFQAAAAIPPVVTPNPFTKPVTLPLRQQKAQAG